jgi:hypothetical protein
VLCPVPGKKYPGAGSREHEREILPLRVFLAAAGCLRQEKRDDPTHAVTLKKLETFCGSLQLDEEDKVHEAMSLLMMALQGFSGTIKAVQQDLAYRCNGNNKTLNLDMFYTAMAFIKHWDSSTTLKHMERGRALFHKADLWPEEVICGRLYTGPQFMHYNCSLREFPVSVLDTMRGNRYVTTIHGINSAIIKLARASPIHPLVVHRGSAGMRLPLQFAAKDDLGRQGDVEFGFMSCTLHKKVALDYAAGGKMPMLLSFERGATNNGGPLSPLSFYKGEEEICFPPLSSLEVKGKPQILFTDKGPVLEVKMGITVNQKAETIDGLIGRRRFLHQGMLRNLEQEVESELKPLDTLLGTISKLAASTGVAASTKQGDSKNKGSGQVLDAFGNDARQTCREVAQQHDKKSAAEFNDDNTYCVLVQEAVDMKQKALKEESKVLGTWFADCAKADLLGLEEVVRQLDAHMWIDTRVVDKNTGETPLIAACGASSVEICEALIKAGADVRQVPRHDGDATAFTLSVMSGNWSLVEFLLKHNTKGLELGSPSPLASASNFLQLASAYAQPHGIHARVRDGSSALALKGEMGALVALLEQLVEKDSLGALVEKDSTLVDFAKTCDKLSNARAFVNHHVELLQNPPVPLSHTVMQLVLQEPDEVFGGNDAQMPAADEGGQPAIIEWVIKSQTSRPCQLTIRGEAAVLSVAYSKDGRQLARAEGNTLVLCCAKSGIEQCRLTGHSAG